MKSDGSMKQGRTRWIEAWANVTLSPAIFLLLWDVFWQSYNCLVTLNLHTFTSHHAIIATGWLGWEEGCPNSVCFLHLGQQSVRPLTWQNLRHCTVVALLTQRQHSPEQVTFSSRSLASIYPTLFELHQYYSSNYRLMGVEMGDWDIVVVVKEPLRICTHPVCLQQCEEMADGKVNEERQWTINMESSDRRQITFSILVFKWRFLQVLYTGPPVFILPGAPSVCFHWTSETSLFA